MKKYNLSKIMKRAWELVKKIGMTISEGLKKAWKEAKDAIEKIKFTGYAAVVKLTNGEANPNIGTYYDSESNYLYFSLWEKYGKKRIYINDYKRRTVGFIDCLNNNRIDTDNKYVYETAKYFTEHYEF